MLLSFDHDPSLVDKAFIGVAPYPLVAFLHAHGCHKSEGAIPSGNMEQRKLINIQLEQSKRVLTEFWSNVSVNKIEPLQQLAVVVMLSAAAVPVMNGLDPR